MKSEKQNKEVPQGDNQNLFETLQRLFDVTPLQDDMFEVITAVELDNQENTTDEEEKTILQEASDQLKVHDSDRGNIGRNFDEIAAVARLITGKSVSAEDCFKIMIAVKLIREKASHNRDNLVDLVAYANALHERSELPF